MPRFDKTGPEGKGSQTGRGMGKCSSSNDSNVGTSSTDNMRGRGQGRRRGLGRGLGRSLGFGKGKA